MTIQEPRRKEKPVDRLTDQELRRHVCNMLIKLDRITRELGSLSYQARELKKVLAKREVDE